MRFERKDALRRRRDALLVAMPLVACGVLPFAIGALADGTAAGTSISNTATATYNDPNNPGQTLNATSNTVSITIAEVAGITVTPSAVSDSTPATGVLP